MGALGRGFKPKLYRVLNFHGRAKGEGQIESIQFPKVWRNLTKTRVSWLGQGLIFFFNDNMIIMQDFAGHLPCCCRYKRAVSMIFSDGSGERPGAVASNALSCPPFEG